ncbi:MAG TPA: cyclophilin-like fold protein [Burkholderiales bacterium]|nr:cyclophilin-like fold protein [Burkholderiales bacterium]
MNLRIEAGQLVLMVELLDTPTAKALVAALPFEARAQTWGEEVYFTTPVSVKLEPDAKQIVEPGTVCFWTEGNALALPYGRTPISSDERPKLASRCNVVGRLEGDPQMIGKIRSGEKLKVSKA